MFKRLEGDSINQFGTPIPGNMISSNQFMFTTTTQNSFQLPGITNAFSGNLKLRPVGTRIPVANGPNKSESRAHIPSASRQGREPEMLSTTTFPNSDKLAKNPALKELNIYEELEIFKGLPPDYSVRFSEEQQDEILNFLNDLYTEMHSDRITIWNNDIYKNVKKDRNKFIQEKRD